jgi:ankyrin repeat protein
VDILGWTPLYWAAAKNDTSILFILLEAMSKYGTNVNIEDNLIGRSPLHVAAANGNVEAVRLLISYGASINQRDAWGWTAFDCALVLGNAEVMNALIGRGTKIDIKDPLKILLAISPCNTFAAYLPLKQLEVYDYVIKLIQGYSLCYAAKCCDMQKVYNLLASGVNANASSDLGSTALREAAKGGHKEVAEILILCEAAINAQDSLGITPLSYAIEYRRWKVAETLISHRADFSL